MTRIAIPRSLAARGEFNGYTDENAARKQSMHTQGKTFLKTIAKVLGLGLKDYDLRSNQAGPACSGEVTLHADHLYIQISESFSGPGLSILFRGCDSRKDYCGHQNNNCSMEQFGGDLQEHYLKRMKQAMENAAAKALQPVAA